MSTIREALQRLKDAYPREPFAPGTQRVYALDLADLPDQAVYDAVVRLIRTSVYRPTIATIRLEVAEAECGLPTAEQAWDMALAADPNMPNEVRSALAASGGRWSLRYSENQTATRAQFVRDYEARRNLRIRETAAGDQYQHLLPASVEPMSLNGRRVAQIPVTTRIHPRPVMWRLSQRLAGRILGPPTDEEKRDAIRILAEGPCVTVLGNGDDDPTWIEAQRIMDESCA